MFYASSVANSKKKRLESINSLRSAVVLILGPYVGENTLVKRFCISTLKLQPAQPRYDLIWDPKKIFDFNEGIPLELLLRKVAVLLVLTTGHDGKNHIKTLRLSQWIKNTLQESGVDTSIFTAYNSHHASTSAAKKKGVNIDLIRKTTEFFLSDFC
ncbi:hypothetical protein ALC57_02703 [Trachymyrmex cornetzi]|uniref:Uncharacterized protein n=1 Tax=Trachymyrmex cornetzi TaxID=471704 RepID=A0A151JN88_9HYME|nr:hypothetical protein ALC57_02703 [Trachymyrmex cornetzi]